LILGAAAVVALLWCGYWLAARTIAEAAIDRANAGPIAGHRVTCSGERLGGFPLRLDFRCARATYTADGDRVTAALGGIRGTAPLYRPGLVTATLDTPFVANVPTEGIALTGEWSSGTADAAFGFSGLRGLGARFVNLTIENNDSAATLPVNGANAASAAFSVSPAGGGSYRIAASGERLGVSLARGGTLPAIDLEARLTALDVGPSLGRDPGRTLIRWLRAGGTAEIEQLRIAATGAVLDAEGTLTLSSDGVISGALVLRFVNLEAFADLIVAIRPGSRERVTQALAALSAFTVPVETDAGPARQTALVITDGLVSVGIIPVGVIPAIRF
jgi:hypothetical protein